MTLRRKGETVEVVITWLEMNERPGYARPQPVGRVPAALIRAVEPPTWYFTMLYRAVGEAYEWVDRLSDKQEDLQAFVQDPKVALYTFLRDGWPAGFFMLDSREAGTTDISYFGLVPEAVGKGLGTWLLQTAVHMGWDVPDTTKLTLNTCTLDHPRALPQYQKHGFQPVRQSTYDRVLSRDWDPSKFP